MDDTLSHQVVNVRREAVATCISCPLCRKLFREATTIIECLHTFCRKCIYKKLSDEKMGSCPVCNIDLGCAPLEKLRSAHNLQDVRDSIFPNKRMKVKAPKVESPVTLPSKRKEKTHSPLVVSTPRVSTESGMTGTQSKPMTRKASRSRFTIEKPCKKEDNSLEDQHDRSDNQNTRESFAASEPSNHPRPDKGRDHGQDGSMADKVLDECPRLVKSVRTRGKKIDTKSIRERREEAERGSGQNKKNVELEPFMKAVHMRLKTDILEKFKRNAPEVCLDDFVESEAFDCIGECAIKATLRTIKERYPDLDLPFLAEDH